MLQAPVSKWEYLALSLRYARMPVAMPAIVIKAGR